MKKRMLATAFSIAMLFSVLALPASAVEATLNKGRGSAWAGQVQSRRVILSKACNDDSSARNVYFDFKYYNGSKWVTDMNAANLNPNSTLKSPKKSNNKDAQMSWILQINTWNCWYSDCYAYGIMEATS